MEIYLLKSAACLAVFFSFYKLLLERESIHNLKRFYLIGSLVISFVIPLITFTTYVETSEGFTQIYTGGNTPMIVSESKEAINYLPLILWSIYGIGVLFFSLKFFRNLNGLIQKIRKNPTHKVKDIINVLLQESVVPHTFFKYIFLNQQKFESKNIPEEVLLHEEIHARQKHSIDILFIELLQILFWFNPLIYLIKRSIKLNHEFLADKAVLNRGVDLTQYQQTLLAFSSSADSPILANSINYSFIKKRFTVMKTNTTKKTLWFRSLLLLPLLAVLLYSFSTKEVIEKEKIQVNETKVPITLFQSDNEIDRETIIQEKASKEQVAEYNKLAKKYNSMSDNMVIRGKELERIRYIYNLMTLEQRRNAEPFPNFPPPPPLTDTHRSSKNIKVIKGVNNSDKNIPPPPPPHVKKIKTYKTGTGEIIEVEEVPEYSENIEIIEVVDAPAPPPPPVPALHMKELAAKGAVFYMEEKEISAKEAIDLVKESNSINISITEKNSQKPIVKLSTKPIVVKTIDNDRP